MNIPLELPDEANILVAGAGGGYDVVCALPVALALKEQGHQIHLANYSFTELDKVENLCSPLPHLFEVTKQNTPPPSGYFPEGYLARWWDQVFPEPISVWSYNKLGVQPLAKLFAHLVAQLKIQAIVLVDAGVDGLFEGTEHELGTPSIDIISILAASHITHIPTFYCFTAFGSEGRNHSVRHADALMRISQQVALGGMRGVSAALPQSTVGKMFFNAVGYIHDMAGPDWHSNMASSIISAMKGKFGHQDLTQKTTEAPIWISPLTLLYWFFDLELMAQAKPFRDRAMKGETVAEMAAIIEETRQAHGVLPRLNIPI